MSNGCRNIKTISQKDRCSNQSVSWQSLACECLYCDTQGKLTWRDGPKLHPPSTCVHKCDMLLSVDELWSVMCVCRLGNTYEGSHKSTLPFDPCEQAANAVTSHLFCYPCRPIFFFNRMARQIWTAQHAQHHLSTAFIFNAVQILSCPIFFFNNVLRQVWAAQHAHHHLSTAPF